MKPQAALGIRGIAGHPAHPARPPTGTGMACTMEEEMKLIASASAALGLALAATPALAQLPETRIVSVPTGDIDLSTPKGQKELAWRIDRAVRDVCQTHATRGSSRILSEDAKACIARARNGAQAQVARLMAAEELKGG